ncbi:MAG: serine/threonine protein kinase, partial [Polyangiaceae bacterium]
GIIHRDLKPENIFLVRDKKTGKDFAKLVDFGVSKFAIPQGGSMTRTGSVIGTPFYMSPEQAKGAKQTDHRADLYSIGVVLYECATGRVPFHAETFNELMFKIVLEEAPDPTGLAPELDRGFAAIIRKAMARAAEDRYQDAATFQQAIDAWLQASGFLGLSGTPVPMNRTPAPPDRAHSVGPLGETAVQAPGGPGVALSTSASTQLSKSGSLQGAASTAAPHSPKKTGPIVTAVAVALAVVAGVVVSRRNAAAPHAAEASQPTPVHAAAPPSAAPEPVPPAASATPPVVLAPPATAAGATTEASASTEHAPTAVAPVHAHAAAPAYKAPSAPRPPAPPAATAANTGEQIKGRTIRTDL